MNFRADGLDAELEAAVAAVREAAALCRAVQKEMADGALEKKDRSPVTVADFGSQALICRALRSAFPEDAIVAEEHSEQLREVGGEGILQRLGEFVRRTQASASNAEVCEWIDYGASEANPNRFWTLDPIDGTKGFLRGDQYAVALALIEQGTVQVAALGCPNLPPDPARPDRLGALFAAVRGQGAFVVSLDEPNGSDLVRVSPRSAPSAARFCEPFESEHSSHGDSARVAAHLGITAPPLRLDSQAKYALVASGAAEVYLRVPRGTSYLEKIWDHAAGYLIVREAGGRVTDLRGAELDFTRGRELSANQGILVTNGPLHEPVLTALAAVMP